MALLLQSSVTEWIAVVLGVIANGLAGFAAWQAKQAATQAARAARAAVISELISSYSADEMGNAVKTIVSTFRELQKQLSWETVFAKEREASYRDLDLARRKLSLFCYRAWLLFHNELLDEKGLKSVVRFGTVTVLLEAVAPLNAAIDASFEKEHLRSYRKLYAGEINKHQDEDWIVRTENLLK